MDIEYIKRFIAVGQCLNFSKAAELMFISQPTLSHSITCLEKQLGTPLLVRSTKSVKLTRAGEIFLPAAIEIVDRYQKVANDISQEMNLHNDVLNIGYMGPATDTNLTGWVKQFRSVSPEVKVRLMRYSSTSIVEAFLGRSIHLGMLYEMIASGIPGLKYQQVGTERFKVLINCDHPLASQPRIDLMQLKDEPFLICERTSSPYYYDRVLAICEARGLTPKISQRLSLVGDIYRVVGAGLGFAIMSYSHSRNYDTYDVKFIDIDDGEDLINNIVLAWADNLSAPARQFKEIAKMRYAP